MAEPFTVRRLARGDLALFRAMNALFAEVFEDAESYAGAPPDEAYVDALLAKEHVIPLVALEGEAVIGALVGYELEKCEQARSEIYIYDLAVDARHRRKGVATALIDRVRSIARERGAWVVYVQADYGDEPAIALYTKFGAREDVMHFDIDPGEQRS
jgi:aminoglycoside 3-N-acetyltransferase I